MKCNKCNAEWTPGNASISMGNCPFCGATLIVEAKTKEVTLESALKQLINDFGISILQNPKKCIAIFRDTAPQLRNEQKILEVAMNFGVGSFFINCPPEDRKKNVNRAMQSLEFLNNESKKLVITALVKALDWEDVLLQDFVTIEERKDEKLIPVLAQKQKILEPKGKEVSQKDLEALYLKGVEYYNANDYINAVKYYCKAAKHGHASAQNNLGWLYQNGFGVAQDDVEAVQWYRKSAEQGHADAQSNLGWMYQNGCGVAKNYAEAVKWYRKSAEQGNSWGQNNLGWTYQNGFGVMQDDVEAVKWYRKSAEQGNSWGQNNLGWMYQNGFGVTQDVRVAKQWYEKAAACGNKDAKKNLEELDKNGRLVNNDIQIKFDINFGEPVYISEVCVKNGDEICCWDKLYEVYVDTFSERGYIYRQSQIEGVVTNINISKGDKLAYGDVALTVRPCKVNKKQQYTQPIDVKLRWENHAFRHIKSLFKK